MSGILVVTGGGRGIGAETSLKAADAGWDICVNYQGNAARAESVVGEIVARGQRAIAVQADISVEADVIWMFETCDAELGRPTGLVNSAGILEPLSRIDEMDGDALVRHMMINVVGSILCAREAVASVHYGASKGAINSFTFGLAQEVAAEGVRVCAVSPGVIDTEIQPAGRVEAVGPALPMQRVGRPEEVANAVVWLLSDEASYVSGTVLDVSGAR